MERLTIGQVAEAAGVPTSTVRYYERVGLVRPSSRSASNYRLYSSADAERLRFIKAARATGFPLDDVMELLRPAPCRRVQGVIEERLEVVEERLRELRRVRGVLKAALSNLSEADEAATTSYEASGVFEAADTESGTATFTHEPIPALKWPDMTMDFGLDTPELTAGIAPGTPVRFTFEQRAPGEFVITRIDKVKPGAASAASDSAHGSH